MEGSGSALDGWIMSLRFIRYLMRNEQRHFRVLFIILLQAAGALRR
jgi:hypothetical protein